MKPINVSSTELLQKSGEKRTRKSRAGGDGNEFPLRVAKITRVDAKKMTVDIMTFTGNHDTYENVALTFPNAGARHFMGAIPEVNDLCLIDYSPAESGASRKPYIVGWLVPGTDVAYDWMVTQLTNPKELDMNPKVRQELSGIYGRRRHKLRQMEAGNIVASSSQGSDMILSEDLLLTNRRGNEIVLRDSDQSIVMRSLQQFHAGSGFRVYSGMVQRDANLLPKQLFSDGIDYTAPKQLEDDGTPLDLSELDVSDIEPGKVKLSNVFDNDQIVMGVLNPRDILARGFFIDDEGMLKDPDTLKGAVYGGKSFYRVSKDLTNSVYDNGTETFTEYRIEVSHTADGTLPVTEQTDGIDIDRLPQNQISDDLGDFKPNSQNKSINTPMVEMVMGTAIGNDHINEPDSYGVPLVAQIFNAEGDYAPAITAASPGTPVTSHLAWLLKIKNPTSNTPPAFMAVTKGGALKQYFPGVGSDTFEEYYAKGRLTGLGKGKQNISQKFVTEGSFQVFAKSGDIARNSGIALDTKGSINLFATGYSLEGGLLFGSDVNAPGAQKIGIELKTPHSTLIESGKEVRIQGSSKILLEETDILKMTSNKVADLQTETAVFTFKDWDINIEGNVTADYSGKLTEEFHASLLTGFAGKPVIVRKVFSGGRNEDFKIGKLETKVAAGRVEFQAVTSEGVQKAMPEIYCGQGVGLSTGLEFYQSEINLLPGSGVKIESSLPFNHIKLESKRGTVDISGDKAVLIESAIKASIKAPQVTIRQGLSVPGTKYGGVLTDGCKDNLTGRSFRLSGTKGCSRFRVGP